MTDGVGAPEEIRTPDPQIRSLVLYPAELRARLAIRCGDEPITAIRPNEAAVGAGDRPALTKTLAAQRQGWNLTEN